MNLHEYSALDVGRMAGVSRATAFKYLEQFLEGGVEALLARDDRGGKKARMSPSLQEQLVEKLKIGEFRRTKEAQAWLREQGGCELALSTMYYWLAKSRGNLEDAAQRLIKRKIRRWWKPSEGRQQIA